ncbi:hypothetical protein MSG28_006880 [Choristoneura fumiferana]|uniref:Uncharacterized protein n=1 Tax=Choristoneura fumiferana TaxID=7141 RepID=A0ACC0JLM4_CHOFU|nr:hypothetical protein MSG28_006880 [Choristoneura fumiferana]
MEKELDASIVKATQTSLGKYVKRPPLSEKLLKKPPFRFLHDIITTVLKTTGFFEGLFEEQELVSDNVKDRESKILFLNKVISVIGLTTGKSLSAKPSKIVAGQEPEKTNELLQCLAQALDSKLSSVEAVKKIKEVKNPSQISDTKVKESKVTKKNNDTKNIISKSTEKLTSQKKEQKGSSIKNGNQERVSKPKDRESTTLKQESPPKIPTQKSKIINKKTQVENGDQPTANSQSSKKSSKISNKNLEKSFDEKNESSLNSQKEPEINIPDLEISLPGEDEVGQGTLDTSYTIADTDLNSSSSRDLMASNNKVEDKLPQENNSASFCDSVAAEKDYAENTTKDEETTVENKEHKEDTTESKNQNNFNLRQDSIPSDKEIKHQDRFTSAKNGEIVSNNVRPTSVRPSSSRPGAPRFRDKHGTMEQGAENIILGKVNIIAENTTNEEEEEPSIIIVEHQLDDKTSVDQTEQLSLNQHGHLVQQILDSQKEFSQVNGKTEIEWQFGAQKAREASNQEMELVRFNIQAVSRAANPLGKLLDHIQEDVEVMRQELQEWTKTYEETSKELLKQKTANDDSLLPLHTKIKQLDSDIKEKQDKIEDLKIVIHKNSSRIEKLLASGNVQ